RFRSRPVLPVTLLLVEVEEGVGSALLPFRTTPDLVQDARVEWRYYTNDWKYIHVHVAEKKSAQPGEQDDRYRNRTKMNEDPWTTGDCSLTLNDLQQDDSGTYKCKVIRDGDTLRGKTVELKVKGQSSDAGQRSGVSLSSVSSQRFCHLLLLCVCVCVCACVCVCVCV
uniref:Ig-like domain-containing protein n=1 Tax=Sphaeramia orbicularis TaxID=375764 RepID=A0A673A731_9TELE